MLSTRLLSTLALSATLFGCGGGADTPELVPVSGTVTVDGQPVEGVTVMFAPKASGRKATGVTNSEGRYELVYTAGNYGATPGEYRVVIDDQREVGVDADGNTMFEGGNLPPKYSSGEIERTVSEDSTLHDFEIVTAGG